MLYAELETIPQLMQQGVHTIMLMPTDWGAQPDSDLFLATLDEVLGTAARLFATRMVAVSRMEGTTCTLMAVIDHKRQIRPGTVLHLDDTLCAQMLEQNAPLQINDISALPNAKQYTINPLNIPVNAYLGVPLCLANGRVFGSLWTIDSRPYAFTPSDVRMLSLLARSLTHELESAVQHQHDMRIQQLQATHADIDPLTGILGCDGFKQALRDIAAQPAHAPYSVVVVKINPLTPSRIRSDIAHQGLVDALMRTVRLVDCCGRIDDSMYAVLLPNTTEADSQTWQQRVCAEVDAWNRVHRNVDLVFEIVLGAADSSQGADVLERARKQIS